MWEALKYVSSGFTLCAFIVATVVFYLNHRIKEERKRIEAAPAEDRASLVAKTLEVFHVEYRWIEPSAAVRYRNAANQWAN